MNAVEFLESVVSMGIVLSLTDDDKLTLGAPTGILDSTLLDLFKQHKPELIRLLSSAGKFGECVACHAQLIGMPTFDGFYNRMCPKCGRWHRCVVVDNPTVTLSKHSSGELLKLPIAERQQSLLPAG